MIVRGEEMEQIIYIEQKDKDEATRLSKSFTLKDISSRAYINGLGAEIAMKYLAQEGINVENAYNLHNINKIREDFDIADVMLPNIHIDVRMVYNADEIFVPKSHFEYDLLPDIYLVFEVAQDSSHVKFLGFFEPKMINKNNKNKDYYFIEKEKLSNPADLKSFIQNFNGNTTQAMDEDEIELGQKLALSMLDHDITKANKKELLQMLKKSSVLRQDLIEFDNFELISYHAVQTKDFADPDVETEAPQQPMQNVDEFDLFDTPFGEDKLIEANANSIDINAAPAIDATVAVPEISAELPTLDTLESAPTDELSTLDTSEDSAVEELPTLDTVQDSVTEELPSLEPIEDTASSDIEPLEANPVEELNIESTETSALEELSLEPLDTLETVEETTAPETTDSVEELNIEPLDSLETLETIDDLGTAEPVENIETSTDELNIEPLDALGDVEELSVEPLENTVDELNIEPLDGGLEDMAETLPTEDLGTTDTMENLDTLDSIDTLDTLGDIDTDSQVEDLSIDSLDMPLEETATSDEISLDDLAAQSEAEDDNLADSLDSLGDLLQSQSEETSDVAEESTSSTDEEISLDDFESMLSDAPQEETTAAVASAPVEENAPVEAKDMSFENSRAITNENIEAGEIQIDINNENLGEQTDLGALYDENAIPEEDITIDTPKNEKGKKAILLAIVTLAIVAAGAVFLLFSNKSNNDNLADNPTTDNIVPNELPTTPNDGALDKMPEDMAGAGALPATGGATAATTTAKKAEKAKADAVAEKPAPKGPAIETPYLEVKKLSWSVPDYISYNDAFRGYLQTAGKSLKLSLSSDLLLATEYAYSNKMQVDLKLSKEGAIQTAKILQSSGSTQIDDIVLRTVKTTMNVLKAPTDAVVGDSLHLTLIIYL